MGRREHVVLRAIGLAGAGTERAGGVERAIGVLDAGETVVRFDEPSLRQSCHGGHADHIHGGSRVGIRPHRGGRIARLANQLDDRRRIGRGLREGARAHQAQKHKSGHSFPIRRDGAGSAACIVESGHAPPSASDRALVCGSAWAQAPVRLRVGRHRRDPAPGPRRSMTMPAKAGPMTLLYPEWIPGEHSPTGPDRRTWSGSKSRAADARFRGNATTSTCSRSTSTCRRASRRSTWRSTSFRRRNRTDSRRGGSTTSELAVLNWNQLLLYPQGARRRQSAVPGDADAFPSRGATARRCRSSGNPAMRSSSSRRR